jgi:hypothetical protein
MDSTKGMLFAVVIGIALLSALAAWVIPEPPQRAFVSMDRLDVVVLPFANSSSWAGAGDTVGARTQARLVQAPGIEVYSRAEIDALLGEQVISGIGFLDPDTAARIGSLTGVARLVGGMVYSVQFVEHDTTICDAWEDGECVTSIAAIERSVRLLAQIYVMDAMTGRVETVIDSAGEEVTVTRMGTRFLGADELIAAAADAVAADVASTLTDTYTRELRYGVYSTVEPKRSGYVGREETSRFYSSGGPSRANLVIHCTRVKIDDEMSIIWLDGESQVIREVADVVRQGEWRLYSLDVAGLAAGRYAVIGFLNGVKAFEKPFAVEP